MKDFIIFTDGDVDVPKPYDRDVVMLPQYYYFDPNVVYGDEQILTRESALFLFLLNYCYLCALFGRR